MGNPSRNDGKRLEQTIQAALQQHHLHNRSNFVRLYDQTSTGGRGFALPGDFYWFVPGNAILIECKSTAICKPLLSLVRSSKHSKDQIPRHRLHHLSGHPSVYLYGDLLNDEITAYDGESVVAAVNEKKKDLVIISKADMSSTGGLLDNIIQHIRSCK